MTFTDQLLPTAAPPPSPRRRRRVRHRSLWVVAATVVGALVGGGLALVLTEQVTAPAVSSQPTPTTPQSISVPSGLIAGSVPPVRPATHSIDNRVFVVGDSVMQGAAPYLGDQLDGWSVIADTEVGRFLDEATRVIVKRRDDVGEIAVLNLGNNYGGDKTIFAAEVERALDELDGVDHVIWVNVGEFKDDRADVNKVLAAAVGRHPNLVIVDWNSWWKEHPEFTGHDRLHLTGDGANAYAALVALAVRQVTDAAGEIPAPGAKTPELNTSGRIPGRSSGSGSGSGSGSRSGSGSSTRRSTTRNATVTTDVSRTTVAASGSGGTPTTVAGKPTTTAGPSPTSPGPTTPPTTPAATSPPVTSPPTP